ncbi:MAG: heavy metal translocating P-type ATPase [Candidatus Endonucleobacter bathymodioli]|uniref:Heavy metal translocating P-type ATPase n=1 Tax=Candidatus Endonucleibacter bathymodioli TaxID=539814 RepID=A0AA90SSH9_9GAMM|nr:heavy metal translocating P-type ATPase [Candidatus Endonucleobacter bathymodioli]
MTDIFCYHCQLPTPNPALFHAEVDCVQQPMCCPGCKAVTEAIIAGGLDCYYERRTEVGKQADLIGNQLRAELLIYDRPDIQQSFVQPDSPQHLQANLLIGGITCAACVWLLEKHLSLISGVTQVYVNLSTHEAQITWKLGEVKLSELMEEVYRIGYTPHPWQADRQEALLKEENQLFIRRLAVSGIGAMQVMMYAIALYAGAISHDMEDSHRDFIRYVSAIVATPVVFFAATLFFKAAIRNIRMKHLGMDIPVSIAIGGAYIASLLATFSGTGEIYFDSVCMFTFFLLTGRYLELKARHATSRSARELTNLLPVSCLKLSAGQWMRVPLMDLKKNDIVRVLPGNSIPADGIIASGSSSLDESMLTGEYMPIIKKVGQTVLGGSINKDNAIDVTVTHIGNQTQMAGIVALLRRARQEKPEIARLADKVAGWFVGVVLIVSVVVYFYWFNVAPENAFWITLSVLVVTCPCALSLATPAALTAATGCLHRVGLLVTRGHVLEGLNQINHIIFDKTGTLTQGELILAEVLPCKNITISKLELINLAAALEAHSEHPIAKAFGDHFNSNDMRAENVINHMGKGLEGSIDGNQYRIGKPDFALTKQAILISPTKGQWLLLACNNRALCWFRITDSLRPEAKETILNLKASGYKITLLSGDQEGVVATIARNLNIEDWYSETSPSDKMTFVRRCQQQGDRVLMVGDGINDIPVLAGADISLAMGNASDLARTNADAVLLSMDLSRLPEAFQLSRKIRAIIRQNLTWALSYNLIALPLACAGMVAPWMASTGMALSSIIVVMNALRLNTPFADKKSRTYKGKVRQLSMVT